LGKFADLLFNQGSSLMPQWTCPSCNQIVQAADDINNAIIACVECGSCLHTQPLGSGNNKAAPQGAAVHEKIPPRDPRASLTIIVFCLFFSLLAGFVLFGGMDWHMQMLAGFVLALMVFSSGVVLWKADLRSQPVRGALVVPLPDGLPSEAGNLGIATTVYRTMSLASSLGFIATGLFFCALGAVGVSMLLNGYGGSAPPALALLGPLSGFTSIYVGLKSICSRYYLLVCSEGLLRLQNGQVDVCRWDEIEAFEEKGSSERQSNLWRAYTLRRTDGKTFVIKGNHLEHIDRLGVTLRRELFHWMLPVLVATYRSGGTLTFGKLRVSQDGISVGASILPWEEVAEVEVTDECISVIRKGTRRCWAKAKTAGMPNAMLFPAVAQEIGLPGAPVHRAR
jgi:hypothetical protein